MNNQQRSAVWILAIFLVVPVLLLMLTGCIGKEPESRDLTDVYRLPKEMQHCKVFRLTTPSFTDLTAIHCPNSTTSILEIGKNKTPVIVVDGVEYTPRNKDKD